MDSAEGTAGSRKVIVEPAENSGDPDAVYEYLVHQATGMIMVQTQLSPDEALQRLESFAEATNVSRYRVAEDVIARRLTFD